MHPTLTPIGMVKTDTEKPPRHWTVSEVTGTLVIDQKYVDGLQDIQKGDRIVVLFHFHKSQKFTPDLLIQKPPHLNKRKGVFSICSPRRPNPIGLSVLEVLKRQHNILHVKGLDMLDGTPILDIKPHMEYPSTV